MGCFSRWWRCIAVVSLRLVRVLAVEEKLQKESGGPSSSPEDGGGVHLTKEEEELMKIESHFWLFSFVDKHGREPHEGLAVHAFTAEAKLVDPQDDGGRILALIEQQERDHNIPKPAQDEGGHNFSLGRVLVAAIDAYEKSFHRKEGEAAPDGRLKQAYDMIVETSGSAGSKSVKFAVQKPDQKPEGSPESAKEGEFTVTTQVWSYFKGLGVTVTENADGNSFLILDMFLAEPGSDPGKLKVMDKANDSERTVERKLFVGYLNDRLSKAMVRKVHGGWDRYKHEGEAVTMEFQRRAMVSLLRGEDQGHGHGKEKPGTGGAGAGPENLAFVEEAELSEYGAVKGEAFDIKQHDGASPASSPASSALETAKAAPMPTSPGAEVERPATTSASATSAPSSTRTNEAAGIHAEQETVGYNPTIRSSTPSSAEMKLQSPLPNLQAKTSIASPFSEVLQSFVSAIFQNRVNHSEVVLYVTFLLIVAFFVFLLRKKIAATLCPKNAAKMRIKRRSIGDEGEEISGSLELEDSILQEEGKESNDAGFGGEDGRVQEEDLEGSAARKKILETSKTSTSTSYGSVESTARKSVGSVLSAKSRVGKECEGGGGNAVKEMVPEHGDFGAGFSTDNKTTPSGRIVGKWMKFGRGDGTSSTVAGDETMNKSPTFDAKEPFYDEEKAGLPSPDLSESDSTENLQLGGAADNLSGDHNLPFSAADLGMEGETQTSSNGLGFFSASSTTTTRQNQYGSNGVEGDDQRTETGKRINGSTANV
ncbi:unnamed protein product [Amoebophrya sp. A120]|nr:unnamed protein product [Amoebophrya sp. A120]|eukprot:GSA120T00007086001.1